MSPFAIFFAVLHKLGAENTVDQAFNDFEDADFPLTLAEVFGRLEKHTLGKVPTLKQTIIYTISKNRVNTLLKTLEVSGSL